MCNVPCELCGDFDGCEIKKNKELQCKLVDYDCYNCDYYCHCKIVNDEFHCIFECDNILCPIL